jgi:hypothetical protein
MGRKSNPEYLSHVPIMLICEFTEATICKFKWIPNIETNTYTCLVWSHMATSKLRIGNQDHWIMQNSHGLYYMMRKIINLVFLAWIVLIEDFCYLGLKASGSKNKTQYISLSGKTYILKLQ